MGNSLPADARDSNDGLPSWSGQRQRASLRGFARFRAVLWRRSLRLYQTWKLAGTPWYLPLVKALKKSTGHLDLLSLSRVRGDADIFGETPIFTTLRLLQLAEALDRRPTLFVDLGCGRGVPCLTAASLGIPALGFEQEAEWVAAAGLTAEVLGLRASFQANDFLLADWPKQALFLAVSTTYPEELRSEIAERLVALGSTVSVFTADWSLPSQSFEKLWEGPLPVDWGVARFALWKPIAKPEGP